MSPITPLLLSVREKPASSNKTRWIIIGVIAAVLLLALGVVLVILHMRRRKRDRNEGNLADDDEVTGHDLDNLGVTGRHKQEVNGGHNGFSEMNQSTNGHPPGFLGSPNKDKYSSDSYQKI